jgi:hypothetical protein
MTSAAIAVSRDRHIRQCRPFARKIRISATSEQAFAISELPRLSHSSARVFSHSTSPDDSGASARSASRIAASSRHSPASSASPSSSSRRARFRSRSPSIVGNVRRGHSSASTQDRSEVVVTRRPASARQDSREAAREVRARRALATILWPAFNEVRNRRPHRSLRAWVAACCRSTGTALGRTEEPGASTSGVARAAQPMTNQRAADVCTAVWRRSGARFGHRVVLRGWSRRADHLERATTRSSARRRARPRHAAS